MGDRGDQTHRAQRSGASVIGLEGGVRASCTHPADEALGMPLSVEGGNVVLHDGRVAACTLGGEHVVVVFAAVRLSVSLVEALLAESIPALCAEEVFWMPRLVQGSHTFLQREEWERW